jgi:hypothetical protein
VFANFWRRLRQGHEPARHLKDQARVENALYEHERSEREKRKGVGLPPGRTNTDWTYIPPP